MNNLFEHSQLKTLIEQAWEKRDTVTPKDDSDVRRAVLQLMNELDRGQLRVCEKTKSGWITNEWIKKGVLLFFRLHDAVRISGGPNDGHWFDKIPSKFRNWAEEDFRAAGFRAVPGSIVRHSAFIAKNAVLMPSFVNIGAYVDEGTMVDTWSTIGSCAQIGKNCHISGGVGIGGVLEPLQATPVIIEDNCFIGARSEVAEGMIVEEGCVLSMGVFLGASSKIIDRESGEVFMGRVPAYSVVVPGTLPGKPLKDGSPGPSLSCAVIVKRVDERTRSKTSINDLLRDTQK
jgi:2,3,4,5-tetrahydropyridine-2,6-dicarboxylate N-succinyltransferase